MGLQDLSQGEGMKVLVAYASRHGATAGIAERIGARLSERGFEPTTVEVDKVDDVDSYDAFVVGSAAYMFRWLKEASRFAKRNHQALSDRPTWLFSSGPLGTDLVDEKGRDVYETSRPKEFDELESILNPRGEKIFFGAWDPDAPAVGLAEKTFKKMAASRDALPVGDFRDWDDIDAWADEIADELQKVPEAEPAGR